MASMSYPRRSRPCAGLPRWQLCRPLGCVCRGGGGRGPAAAPCTPAAGAAQTDPPGRAEGRETWTSRLLRRGMPSQHRGLIYVGYPHEADALLELLQGRAVPTSRPPLTCCMAASRKRWAAARLAAWSWVANMTSSRWTHSSWSRYSAALHARSRENQPQLEQTGQSRAS